MNILENNFPRKHLFIFLRIWILCLLLWFLVGILSFGHPLE
jgi:hypothetical protein